MEHDKYEKIEVFGFGSVLEAQTELLTSVERYQAERADHHAKNH